MIALQIQLCSANNSDCVSNALGFPSGSDSTEYACDAEDPGLIPGLGRTPREGNGYPLQYSCLLMRKTKYKNKEHSLIISKISKLGFWLQLFQLNPTTECPPVCASGKISQVEKEHQETGGSGKKHCISKQSKQYSCIKSVGVQGQRNSANSCSEKCQKKLGAKLRRLCKPYG